MTTRALLAVALSMWSTGAPAETLYVTDVLRLGIHQTEDTSDRPFDNLVSGTPVEVLRRIPNFARVKLADGREGWVKSAFLVVEKPAQARVGELEREMAALTAQTEAAVQAQHSAEAELASLTSELQANHGSAESTQARLQRLEAENADYLSRLELYRNSLPWPWVATALAVVFAVGFAAGLWWLDARIRRRHGGFRIY